MVAEFVAFSPEHPGFLLVPSEPRLWLAGDMAIRMQVRIDAWPEDWAYLCAKFLSQQSHEFLVRIKGDNEGRWGYGDGTGEFNALKWCPRDCITLGEWTELVFIRRMNGNSQVYADGTLVAEGELKRQRIPALTAEPITLCARSDGSAQLSAAIRSFELFNGAALGHATTSLGDVIELGPWVRVGGIVHDA